MFAEESKELVIIGAMFIQESNIAICERVSGFDVLVEFGFAGFSEW